MVVNAYYSQCLPGSALAPPTSTSSTGTGTTTSSTPGSTGTTTPAATTPSLVTRFITSHNIMFARLIHENKSNVVQ
ncbi:hypothetical protein C8R41DRAFT_927315 [Lentinula lateritia]|uniref:Uncharacterized protein n=1 Tax=Lentinula lateritia TaxID=40482 RepID=A0ABQ8UW78_9AGAR|nr:hypothetical protein C8R41DRAFT_927315 [Lentinula lateritia]